MDYRAGSLAQLVGERGSDRQARSTVMGSNPKVAPVIFFMLLVSIICVWRLFR